MPFRVSEKCGSDRPRTGSLKVSATDSTAPVVVAETIPSVTVGAVRSEVNEMLLEPRLPLAERSIVAFAGIDTSTRPSAIGATEIV